MPMTSASESDHYRLLTRQEATKRIRDITRLFNYKANTLSEERKNQLLERKLQLEKLVNGKRSLTAPNQKENKLNRTLRFFEKKKVQRKLSQLRATLLHCLSSSSNDFIRSQKESELKQEISLWEDHLLYIQHFPPNRRYISVFFNQSTASHDTLLCRKRIFHRIKHNIQAQKEALSQKKNFSDTIKEDDLFMVHSVPRDSPCEPTVQTTHDICHDTETTNCLTKASLATPSHFFFDEDV